MIIKEFDNIVKKGNVLTEFYTDWCGKCKMLDIELKKLDISVLKINADENRDICKKYGVMSVPTLIYFKEDGTYNSNSGFITSEDIIDFMKK